MAKSSAPAGWAFPAATLSFLRALEANNDRQWFAQNRAIYESAFKQAAADYCVRAEEALARLSGLAHSAKVFRIHRDLRFAKDKTPYNTHLHITFRPAQAKAGPAWFFGLDPRQLAFGTGIFAFQPPELDAYRRRVAGAEGDDLARHLEDLRRDGVRVSEPELKRLPAGYPADHKQAQLLRHKGLTGWIDCNDPDRAASGDIIAASVESFSRLKPLFDWLRSG